MKNDKLARGHYYARRKYGYCGEVIGPDGEDVCWCGQSGGYEMAESIAAAMNEAKK